MPLRPDLYRRLEQRFDEVVIAREDEVMESYFTDDPCEEDSRGQPRKRLEILAAGEEYRINCPFCGDSRKRLWINHMFGYTGEPGVSYLRMANCFNDGCPLTGNFGLKRELYKMIYDDVGGQRLESDVVHQGIRRPRELPAVEAPGLVVALNKLLPSHPACNYVRERGYDPLDLYTRHRVCYCVEAKKEYPLVTGRIVIPIYKHGQLVGWQARLIKPASSKHVPKYYCMPGLAKGSLLYNFDEARRHNYVVVTEGVTDAWRYGAEAVALLGLKPTTTQAQILLATWRQGVIFCMLDGSARDENRALQDLLSINHQRVIRVDLPEDKDPGSCTTDFLRQEVEKAATAHGVDFTHLSNTIV